MDAIGAAIEASDIDELTRVVERICAARDWDDLLVLRDRCVAALERGLQLWPVASHAEYRLALEGPPELAASMLVEGTGHLAAGPLPEVAASTHTWSDLAPHLRSGPRAAVTAHERVVRGEEIAPESVAYADVFAPTLRLQEWEPVYPVALYRPSGGEFPAPDLPPARALSLRAADAQVRPEPDDVVRVLLDSLSGWVPEGSGRIRAVAVEGDAAGAIARAVSASGSSEAVGAPLSASESLAWVAWAASGGGRLGVRRGAAAGRDAAWAFGAALTGHDIAETVDPDELGELLAEIQAWWWTTSDVRHGWFLRLAWEDPLDGLAWVLDAVDS